MNFEYEFGFAAPVTLMFICLFLLYYFTSLLTHSQTAIMFNSKQYIILVKQIFCVQHGICFSNATTPTCQYLYVFIILFPSKNSQAIVAQLQEFKACERPSERVKWAWHDMT
jgi:hypothetical protein